MRPWRRSRAQPANRIQPVPIESTENKTVFRIDLRKLGWDERPYDNNRMNWFDLVLLEYPYGILDTASDSFQALAELFLLPAGQIRPVPFVRGDWFVWLAAEAEFKRDFLQVPLDERPPALTRTLSHPAPICRRPSVHPGCALQSWVRHARPPN